MAYMKLSQLTPEQKTRLLAELDSDQPMLMFDHTGDFKLAYFVEGISSMCEKQRYDKSYDAIIPLVQKLGKMVEIEDYLESVMESCFWYSATPSQLCDAVLVAIGKADL